MLAGVALVAVVLGGPAPSWAHRADAGREFGLAVGAASLNLVYVPAKLVTAGLGLAVGGLVGVLTGGSSRAAYAVWVPTATGTFLVTPAHMEGEEPIRFIGCDYADRASTMASGEAGSVYEAAYMSR
jgi:hypothetical protein